MLFFIFIFIFILHIRTDISLNSNTIIIFSAAIRIPIVRKGIQKVVSKWLVMILALLLPLALILLSVYNYYRCYFHDSSTHISVYVYSEVVLVVLSL